MLAERYDFEVMAFSNGEVTPVNVLGWLAGMQRMVSADDRVLIYYAGHGLTRGAEIFEQAYLALSDTQPGDWDSALAFKVLRREAERLKARHVLFLLDSCQDGLGIKGQAQTGTPSDPAYYLSRRTCYVIGAGGKQVVEPGTTRDGQHSLFAGQVLRWLTDDSLKPPDGLWRASLMGTYLERAVARERYGHHKPVHGPLSGDGDFLFHWSVGLDVPQAIGKSLHSTSWQVRLEAVGILADMAAGDQVDFAREWLGRLLYDPDARVRQAVQALFAEEVVSLPAPPPAAVEPPVPASRLWLVVGIGLLILIGLIVIGLVLR